MKFQREKLEAPAVRLGCVNLSAFWMLRLPQVWTYQRGFTNEYDFPCRWYNFYTLAFTFLVFGPDYVVVTPHFCVTRVTSDWMKKTWNRRSHVWFLNFGFTNERVKVTRTSVANVMDLFLVVICFWFKPVWFQSMNTNSFTSFVSKTIFSHKFYMLSTQ